MEALTAAVISQSWEKSPKFSPITAKDWEPQRGIFTRLYITEDRKLEDVRRIMAEQYDFFAKYVHTDSYACPNLATST